jgi:adenosine deaminase
LGYRRCVTGLDPRLDDLILRLPKVELHLHLEGSIHPELALRLAHRRGRSLPGMDSGADGLREHYRFASFKDFLRMYIAISACLSQAEDFCEITVALARDLAAQRVAYAEVTFTPMTHVARGVDPAVMLAGLAEGRARALAEHGVELAWVFDIVRCFRDQSEPTLELALRGRDDGVIGLGFAGPEAPEWPTAPFAGTFARARAEGLHSLPHAGEMAGPASIREAIELLGAERIGHGVRAVDDPALLEHLVRTQIRSRSVRRATSGSGCTRTSPRTRCRSSCGPGSPCRSPATTRRCSRPRSSRSIVAAPPPTAGTPRSCMRSRPRPCTTASSRPSARRSCCARRTASQRRWRARRRDPRPDKLPHVQGPRRWTRPLILVAALLACKTPSGGDATADEPARPDATAADTMREPLPALRTGTRTASAGEALVGKASARSKDATHEYLELVLPLTGDATSLEFDRLHVELAGSGPGDIGLVATGMGGTRCA